MSPCGSGAEHGAIPGSGSAGRLGPKPLPYYLACARQIPAHDPGSPPSLARFIEGLKAYWAHPYRRTGTPSHMLWRRGSSRLLGHDHAGREGLPLLLIPSLVNRSYVLDLMPERSLTAALTAAGHPVLTLDWGNPGPQELGFRLEDYVIDRLLPALESALQHTGRRPVLVGYCMGGLIALALAAQRSRDLAGLVLLATPWDFARDHWVRALPAGLTRTSLGVALAGAGQLPSCWLELAFAGLDPAQVIARYAAFPGLPQASERARGFVALEDWLSDGVPLAGPVARECLLDWYLDNAPSRGAWRIGGRPVRPDAIDLPAFVAAPTMDRIVQETSALALADALPNATTIRPPCGHIGMVAGARSKALLGEPLLAWLRRIARDGLDPVAA